MNDRQKGITCIIASAFFFALMNAFVRLSGDIPSMQKSFFRNLVALLYAGIILWKSKEGFHYEKRYITPLLIRSLFGTIGLLSNFYAVDHLLLADASMLQKLGPFFVVIFSFFILKETVRPFQIGAILIAFAGSLLVIKPSMEAASLFPSIIAVIGAMSTGVAYTLVRYLTHHGLKGPKVVFFFSVFSCLSVLPFVICDFHPMTPLQTTYLLMAGLAAAGGQFAVTYAYTFAPAKEISVFDYSQVIFAAVLGFLLFQQIPDLYSLIGYGIIILIAVFMYVYTREKKDV